MPKYRVKRHAVVQPENEAYRLVPLTQNLNAIVDAEDFERVNAFNWVAHRNRPTATFYAMRKGRVDEGKSTVYMHTFIMGVSVDHHDCNGLNNSRSNLRPCTTSQNQANKRKHKNATSRYKGIWWAKDRKHWRCQVMVGRKAIRRGGFLSEESAARVYDELAKEHFGPFARLNFPD
jgi:hypothetical protein